jgi:hypothetical protein
VVVVGDSEVGGGKEIVFGFKVGAGGEGGEGEPSLSMSSMIYI